MMVMGMQDIMDFSPPDTSEQKAALAWLYNGLGKPLLPSCMPHRLGLGARLLTQRCLGMLMQALMAEMTVSTACI